MLDATEAEIVTFPRRPDDRLRLALRSLDEALAEQRAAVAEFRASLADLSEAVGGLDQGFAHYRAALDQAATETARATEAARQLEATAAALIG